MAWQKKIPESVKPDVPESERLLSINLCIYMEENVHKGDAVL